MTRDDIIRMAREAGLAPIYSACDEPGVRCAYEDWDEELERFAALVAAAEREACAEIAEHWRCNGAPRHGVAAEIRARSAK